MLEPHPGEQVLGHGENIPQHVDLKLVKGLVDIGFQERLQLVQTILKLKLGFRVKNIAIFVSFGDGRTVAGVREAQALGRRCKETGLEAGDCLVYQIIDRVDNIIYERLGGTGQSTCQGVGRAYTTPREGYNGLIGLFGLRTRTKGV